MTARSEEIDKISKALVSIQKEIKDAPLDKVNPHFKSRYASLESVINTVRPVSSKYGITFTQTMVPSETGMSLVTTLYHESGQWIDSVMPMKVDLTRPQGVGSCLTYFRRYSLAAIYGISDTEDDDGNEAEKVSKNKEPTLSKEQIKFVESFITDDTDKAWLKSILTKALVHSLKDFPQKWYPDLTKKLEVYKSGKEG